VFSQFNALVIEGNPLSRSVLVRALVELGFKSVAQVTKPREALTKLESANFDFIFCEYHFADSPYTGQVFVDDLRASNLLPLSTAFIMISSECAKSRVTEAAESALDSYILKPFNFNELQVRLLEVKARKAEFKYVYAELALNEFESAAALCESMVSSRARYWVHAARIAAELRLRVGDFDKATWLYEEVATTCALPWSKLGLARVDLEGGKAAKATRVLEGLVADCPTYADAYDVMGRALVAQGDLAGALGVYEKAVSLTPSSLTRLQKLGALAFFQNDRTLAESALEKAFRIGAGSKIYDYQSLVLLAFLRFDSKRDPKFTQSAWSLMRKQLSASPGSYRLETMLETLAVLAALQSHKLSHAIDGVSRLASKILEPLFDFEMACNLLGLLDRMSRTAVRLPEEVFWKSQIATRFATTRVAVDVLSKAAGSDGGYLSELEIGLSAVNCLAQAALTLGMQGKCHDAVASLISQGAESRNARILEVASLVAEKYREALPEYVAQTARISHLRETYCSFGTQVGLTTTKTRKKVPQAVAQFA
jgi:CheY-like chemotaxis protein